NSRTTNTMNGDANSNDGFARAPTTQTPQPTPPPEITNASANFTQYGGFLDHPRREGDAEIRNGQFVFQMTQTQATVMLRGLTGLSGRGDVRDSVQAMNGDTVYTRVPASSLPNESRYKDARFLIFSNSVRNKKGIVFSTNAGEFFPMFPLAGGSEEDFKPLSSSQPELRYPVTFNSSKGGKFSTTVIVRRVFNGSVPCGNLGGFAELLKNQKDYMGISISLAPAPPDAFKNEFPFGTTVYANLYSNGGIIQKVGTCTPFHDSKYGNGWVSAAFNR
ncbi:MAG: hypothetical protein RIQ81_2718, partial [Pseudomonadota bacterium]